ncbi:hypothetical protein HVPorG_05022 [Roseomonas mucosa]|nr:hypothetical protein HVPorG_05022 [Roseomonas mucosa]
MPVRRCAVPGDKAPSFPRIPYPPGHCVPWTRWVGACRGRIAPESQALRRLTPPPARTRCLLSTRSPASPSAPRDQPAG